MDGPVLGQRALQGAGLGHAPPDPGARRWQRHVVDERRQHRVAGADGDLLVELKVSCDEVIDRGLHGDGIKDLAEFGLFLRRHSHRCHSGGGRLKNATHLKELKHGVVTVKIDDEAQRLEQQRRRQASRVRSIALPHVEHVDQGQRLHRLAQRVTGQAELCRQVRLPWQLLPRSHPAGDDHLLDLADRLVCQCHGPAPTPAPVSASPGASEGHCAAGRSLVTSAAAGAGRPSRRRSPAPCR